MKLSVDSGDEMNLEDTTCQECAETIKAAAKVCKHCGYRSTPPHGVMSAEQVDVDAESERAGSSVIKKVLVFTAIAGAVGGTWLLQREAMRMDNPQAEEAAKSFISKDLLDPMSAQFRNINSTSNCVTGEVNAKNAYSAFTGYQQFYYSIHRKIGRVDPGKPDHSLVGTDEFMDQFGERSAFLNETTNCIATP